jgi:methylisocitrate lyase
MANTASGTSDNVASGGMSPGKRLRELADETTIQVPGAPSALVARLIERLGYDAIYLSGAAFSAGVLGLPDVGLFTLSELAQQATYLTRACALPLIVDADTGFGEALNVERTIVELEAAGAAAIQLEDQQFPKRCGHLAGKTLVKPAAMCAKLRAASGARGDADLIVIARTDARGVTGLDDAIDRAKRYLDAGADWIFPEALESKDEFERFARAIEAPLIANMTEFGKSPLLTLDELAELGYSAVLYPVTLQRIAMKACEAALNLLAVEGTQHDLLDLMQTREELYDLLDYQAFEERDKSHGGG